MATTQYIGARYVPLFADPLDWSIDSTYEALTIVYDSGNSYTSRQAVPKGIDITNTKYWALTGNYNAQIEAYRKEVAAYDGRITENASAIAKEVSRAIAEETSIKSLITKAQTAADNAQTSADNAQTSADNALSLAQTNEKDIATLDSEIAGTADSGLKTLITNNASAISAETTRAKAAEAKLKSNLKRSTKNANILCIGDSYGRGVGNNDKGWVDYFAACESTAHVRNISNSGAGFIVNGHSAPYGAINYSGQLDYAAANPESGIANTDIDFVIIAGGWNDNAQSVATLATAVVNCYKKATTLFPNAEIWIFSLSNELNNLAATYANTGITIANTCKENGIRTNAESWFWLKGIRTVTSSDSIHPNDTGYTIMGKAIYLALQGITIGSQNSTLGYGATTTDIVTAANYRSAIKNGVVYMTGSITANFTSENLTFINIPKMYAPRQTIYFLAQFLPTSGTKSVAPIAINTSGEIGIRTPFGASITAGTIYFVIQYPLCCL